MQLLLTTSDNKENILTGWFRQWSTHVPRENWDQVQITVCGFKKPKINSFGVPYEFYSIGSVTDYRPQQWSNAFYKVLQNVAHDHFILSFDDFWTLRGVDVSGLKYIHSYMTQHPKVLKFDLDSDRLYSEGGTKYLFNAGTEFSIGHLDVIKSNHLSPYHMSLWTGFWSAKNMSRVLIPNETAQEIELEGTTRLSLIPDLAVYGTRQAPLKTGNVIQGGEWNQSEFVGLPALSKDDRSKLIKAAAIPPNVNIG